jgi:NAD(P)-dependent dehydrogenase (short-subunit alcohol dehydrogenase family)
MGFLADSKTRQQPKLISNEKENKNMKNKSILITGGTTGIGLATAQLLASEGARVIITGRNPETLAAARATLGESGIIIKSDSSSLEDSRALAGLIRKYTDRLDGVFLNAGIATFSPFEAETPEHYEALFNINVRGPYFQLQSLLPLLGNPSSVVFTASVVASIGFPNTSLYSATKAAVVSFGKTLALELAPRGIRVNVLSPGPIETPIFDKIGLAHEQRDGLGEGTLLKRLGKPTEMAKAARFLLSNDSSFILGEEIVADGGVRLV